MSAIATVVEGRYKITFVYQDKQFTTSVYRRHTIYTTPKYVIGFKSGKRHLSLESNGLSIHFGKPLEEDLLSIIHKAILEQIEPIAEQLPNFKI